MRLLITAGVALLVGSLLVPGRAAALTCSATIADVVFSDVDLLPGNFVDTTATVTISCSDIGVTGVSVCPFIGFGGGGHDATSRLAIGSSGNLRYELYRDNDHATVWGDPSLAYGSAAAVGFAGNVFGTGSGSTQLMLYARIFANQQSISAGTYASIFSNTQTRFVYGPVLPLGILGCDGVITLLNQTTRPTFTVTADIDKNCELTTEDMNFGTHGALVAALTQTIELSVRCTSDAGYTIGLGNGNTGTGPTSRKMVLGGNEITYGLYKDGAFANPWGDSGATTVSGTGNGAEQDYDIHGRVPPQPTPPPGTYTDTIVVTVTY